jgi:hypothetical protein
MAKKRSKGPLAETESAVRALLSPTPPATLRKKPMPLEAEFKARAKFRREQWAARSRHTAAVLKPFHEIVAADKKAMAAARALKNLKRPRRQKLPKLVAPKIKPLLRSGSILTFRPPPFDNQWISFSAGSGNTGGAAFADSNTGEFTAWAQVETSGGSVWGNAGVAVWFQPVQDNTLVRFAPYAPGYGRWDDKSWFGATAHNDGFITILVESWDLNGQNYQQDVPNRQIQQWSDGTGWWDEHGYDQPFSINFPVDTYFLARNIRWYRAWTVAGVYCDGSGNQGLWGSTADSTLSCGLAFVVFEQWT